MKYSKTNYRWRRLMIALLIWSVAPFLSVAGKQTQKVSPRFSYPESQETIKVDAEIKSRSLSGRVIDPGGATPSKVLAERLTPGWRKRTTALFGNSDGRFSSSVGSGTHYLSDSKPAYNT